MASSTLIVDEVLELLDAVDLLLTEAKGDQERRTEPRIPFFRPVTINVSDPEPRRVSAFTRDLSPMGVGLLHTSPIDAGEVVIDVPLGEEPPVRLRCRIKWCAACGEEWYLSGGYFVGVASGQAQEDPS